MTYNVFGGMLNLAHVGANVYGQDVKIHWKQKNQIEVGCTHIYLYYGELYAVAAFVVA